MLFLATHPFVWTGLIRMPDGCAACQRARRVHSTARAWSLTAGVRQSSFLLVHPIARARAAAVIRFSRGLAALQAIPLLWSLPQQAVSQGPSILRSSRVAAHVVKRGGSAGRQVLNTQIEGHDHSQEALQRALEMERSRILELNQRLKSDAATASTTAAIAEQVAFGR